MIDGFAKPRDAILALRFEYATLIHLTICTHENERKDMSVINEPLVLQLNANWERINFLTVKQAVVALCGDTEDGTPPALAIPVEKMEDGSWDIGVPMTWDEWIKLPVKENDLVIKTARGPVRCPTVIVAPRYNKMPLISKRLTRRAILERDGFRCGYSGKVLPISQLNVDHVIPRHRGGKDTWENLVACDRKINSMKGNKLNEEIGLHLLKKPAAPKRIPKSITITKPRHETHEPFIRS